MTPDTNPGITAAMLSWLINAIFAIALMVAQIRYSRSQKRHDDIHDDIDKRLRDIERSAVTHDDLRRLEHKLDEHNRSVTERLDRILERQK